MELKSIVKCFKVPSKIGNVLISSFTSSSGHHDNSTCDARQSTGEAESKEGHTHSGSCPATTVVELSLKDGLSRSTLLDLGGNGVNTLFVPYNSLSLSLSLSLHTSLPPSLPSLPSLPRIHFILGECLYLSVTFYVFTEATHIPTASVVQDHPL